jgi:hypothetical protein
VKHHSADAGAAQLEEHGGGSGSEFGIDEERQGGEQQAEAFDAVRSGLTPEEGIYDCHLDRLGPDLVYDFRPPTPGYPSIPIGIERAKPQQALGGNCGEEQMSQNGPYLSQMGPKNSNAAPPDWLLPLIPKA